MKATIRYKDWCTGNRRRVTVEADVKDIDSLINTAIMDRAISENDYIHTVTRGRTVYVWNSHARNSMPSVIEFKRLHGLD